jgi:mono/diheme cytochrome c family protein
VACLGRSWCPILEEMVFEMQQCTGRCNRQGHRGRCGMTRTMLIVFAFFAAANVARAQSLVVTDGAISKTFTAAQLLADKATRDIKIADPVYKRTMTYRVIAMVNLLSGLKVRTDDYVQARAVDDFSVPIPAALLKEDAFVAIETAAAPWPTLPGGGKKSAGPFYIVWRSRSGAGISSEYWVYHLASLTITESPAMRWPGLAVGADVPAADPARRGLDRFVAVCMACHRFDGEGEGTQGPDLARPMNPVDYFQPKALRKFLRDPRSVRVWDEQKMPAFDEKSLPDSDIDAIVAWLNYKARRR